MPVYTPAQASDTSTLQPHAAGSYFLGDSATTTPAPAPVAVGGNRNWKFLAAAGVCAALGIGAAVLAAKSSKKTGTSGIGKIRKAYKLSRSIPAR
jgi:hypothetical protein